jgi:hypothetical protein
MVFLQESALFSAHIGVWLQNVMFIDSIQSTLIDMIGRAVTATELRAGVVTTGAIEGTVEHPVLSTAGTRLSLPETTNLAPGQQVRVEVAQSENGLQLRLTPLSSDGAGLTETRGASSNPQTANVANVVGAARQDDILMNLLPKALIQTASTFRDVMSLFTQRNSLGSDLETISKIVSQAADEGALSENVARDAGKLLASLVTRDSSNIDAPLRQLARNDPVEAQIAKVILSGKTNSLTDSLRDNLNATLSKLRSDETFVAHLQQKGLANAFDGAVDRTVSRISAGHLQNLHTLEQPYAFFEIPFPAGSSLVDAKLHVFRDGRDSRRDGAPENSMIALDLSTTRLGDLWITLRLADGCCGCRIAATSEKTAEALEAGRAELTEALEGATHGRAMVSVDLWDGNRLRETTQLMRRFSGVDLTV